MKGILRFILSVSLLLSTGSYNAALAWSCTTQQLNTTAVYAGNQNQEIIAVVVTTAPTSTNITSFTFNTTGTTTPLTTISNAKLWYTNSCPVFLSNCAAGNPVQYGATVAAPNGVFTFTASTALNTGCIYYFWLSYDIQAGAAVGATVDAQCTSVTYGTVQAPVITTPAGTRTVTVTLPPTNLVPNPSFEGICPYTTGCSVLANGLGEVGLAYPWYMPAGGTSDYQRCGTGAPLAFVPIPPARTGSSTVGQYFYGLGGYREYVQVPLSRSLIAGNVYEVTYYVRLSTAQAGCQVADMSAYFTNGPFFNYASTAAWGVTPQVNANVLTGSSTAWSLVCGCFIAAGGENYVTLGNFKTDAITTQVGCGFGYFYIDDVGVQDLTQSGNAPICATCGSVLPAGLLFFRDSCITGAVKLNWATTSEHNNDYFDIEKSNDGEIFEAIGMVEGFGNSNETINYSFTDENPNAEVAYYRLKQVDINGQYKLSKLVASACSKEKDIVVYPNPSNGYFIVEGTEKNRDMVITDMLGQVVFKTTCIAEKTEVNISSLPAGTYFITVSLRRGNKVKKMVVE
ncbi:MAG: T9SS type A sorting domain-containing protein [Flavobacteriales bacterium]